MTGGSDRVAGIEPLTIGQLEDRLQLAMAVKQHLTEQRAVSYRDMQVATESLGVELPAHTPLSSFTQIPSQQNYKVAVNWIQSEEEALISKVREATRREITQTLEQIAGYIHRPREPYEPRHKMLKIVAQYLIGYTIPDNHTDETIQRELAAIHEYQGEWLKSKQLGQDVIANDKLWQQAMELWTPVARVLSDKCSIPGYDDEVAFLQAINLFTAAARQASHIEQEQPWSANELVERTVAFMEEFSGPIPYKLQEQGDYVQQLLRDVETMDDQRTLGSLRMVTLAVRDYLAWCWRMDDVRTSAVDTAISISRTAGHLRAMTA